MRMENNLSASAPLNFRVPKDFKREFKERAAANDISMVDLLVAMFNYCKNPEILEDILDKKRIEEAENTAQKYINHEDLLKEYGIK